MTSLQIRQSFLDFFRSKDHRIVPSASVIPHGDATLLFTNAGMNQFKDVFLGTGTRDYKRAADTQKCIRVSGKHNDLEEVGHDTYHHTFFEMLGNWSFGDYYKREAITWAWELLTEVWGLEKKRLHATVFRNDDEAFNFWKEVTDIDPSHIHRFDEKDNFWMMGDTGPCGPCSEIHYDRTPDYSGGKLVNAGLPVVIEIWNLVFIQYNSIIPQSGRDDLKKWDVTSISDRAKFPFRSREEIIQKYRTLIPLPIKHVDTGMGFERVCAVMQGKNSNYDTDVFMPLIHHIENLSGKKYSEVLTNKHSIAMRVMADHIRMLTFSIADGAIPSNEGRGYVLRRILRRAARYSRNLDLHDPTLFKVVKTLVETMGNVFPEIVKEQSHIERVIKAEEEAFNKTLDIGMSRFDQICNKIQLAFLEQFIKGEERQYLFAASYERTENEPLSKLSRNLPSLNRLLYQYSIDQNKYSIFDLFYTNLFKQDVLLDSKEIFILSDTFGFPIDLTELMARERGFTIDREGFEKLLQEQKQRSRDARKAHIQEIELPKVDDSSLFTGYEGVQTEAKVLFARDNQIVLDETPFYVEAGGQVSDTGKIILAGVEYNVIDVRKNGNAYIHLLDGEVESLVGETALAIVDEERRNSIRRNHSATHVVHEALRRVLGAHVKQAGSLVAPDHLRFDFPHFQKITPEELKDIEQLVNEKIRENIEVITEEMTIDQAQKIPGVKMFFGDKYGDRVRVVTIDEKFSKEFCGGTHVTRSPEIGLFKIISESSIAAGTRRIEAVTGGGVEQYIHSLHQRIEQQLSSENELIEKIKSLEKELNTYKLEQAKSDIDTLVSKAVIRNGAKLVVSKIQATDIEQLKSMGDSLREKLYSGVGILASVIDDKVQLVCVVTDDLIKSKGLKAGKIVGDIAKLLGGGGGGKPHLATAGGKDINRLDEALSQAINIITREVES